MFFPSDGKRKERRGGEDEGKKHSRTTKIEIRRCSILPRKKRTRKKRGEGETIDQESCKNYEVS
jgi:hypothetical protein